MSLRSGIGYDSHRLVAGRPLILGGVEIPDAQRGLDGHSDADVLSHAVIDALLGAACLGDIGQRYPDDDERWKDADSLRLLEDSAAAVRDAGFEIVNIDATVICEAPKLAPHREAMQSALAWGADADAVNVKFTTNESIGFVGRGEGVAALATAALREAPPVA